MLRVCDRLVELHLRGGLAVGATAPAAQLLDRYWLGREERMPEEDRRALYARVLGPSFEHLLGRLAAAITAYDAATRDADVAWAAGELRTLIAAKVDGDALAAVALLDAQLAAGLAILSEPEILQAYGARDAWPLAEPLPRHPDRDECVRVRVRDGVATPTGPQGSHQLHSMLGAEGLAIVPRGEGELPAGTEVEVEPI